MPKGGSYLISSRHQRRGADSGCACCALGGMLAELLIPACARLIGAQNPGAPYRTCGPFLRTISSRFRVRRFRPGQVRAGAERGIAVYLHGVNRAADRSRQGAGFGFASLRSGHSEGSRTCHAPVWPIRQNGGIGSGFVRITGVSLGALAAVTFSSSIFKAKMPAVQDRLAERSTSAASRRFRRAASHPLIPSKGLPSGLPAESASMPPSEHAPCGRR